MYKFDQGLNITPEANPLNLVYGGDCFGPEVEYKKLNDIRNGLRNFDCQGTDTVYAIAINVGKKKHIKQLNKQHLLFGVVTYAEGQLRQEPLRSQGHIHKKSVYGQNWSTPKVSNLYDTKKINP